MLESFFQQSCRLLSEKTFFMEYLRATASSRYPPEDLFRKTLKNSKKTPLKKSCFNNFAESRPETLQKHNLTADVFLQILKISQQNLSLKNFVRQIWVESIYSIKMYLQSTSKTLLKTSDLCSL